jgi:NAD-dependent SIR2 family protein deacetylase
MPVDEIDLDGELAPMECEDCGNEIDANDALKQAVINSKK